MRPDLVGVHVREPQRDGPRPSHRLECRLAVRPSHYHRVPRDARAKTTAAVSATARQRRRGRPHRSGRASRFATQQQGRGQQALLGATEFRQIDREEVIVVEQFFNVNI
jgi:hypothetical protein